jgi:dipeptidase E
MTNRRLLLLSNSINFGQSYLEHAGGALQDFLGDRIKTVLFIPYAGVRISYDDYTRKVDNRFQELGYQVTSLHQATNPIDAIRTAEALAVGGGNTFQLLRLLYQENLLDTIRARVNEGMPFIGWSAGSNVACPTIKTTNDMPIAEPRSFGALNLVPFQINPHYTDAQLPNHNGETRAERITEFVEVNPGVYVVGLREGSMLRVEGNSIKLLGDKELRIFLKGKDISDYQPNDCLDFLLQ